MRLAPLIACLIAAALLGAGSARVVATYNVLDVHTSNVPEAPPTVLTTALLNLTATEPIYVRPGRCQRNLVCNATNFVRCCSDDQCDPVTLTRLPTAPTDCACPSFPRVTCVDPSRPYAYGEAGAAWAFTPPNGFSFEIPIARSCRNTLITVSVIRGSFELYLGTASMTLREIFLSALLKAAGASSVGIALCAADGDGDGFLYVTRNRNSLSVYKTDLAADGWGRIRGVLAGFGSFNLTVAEITDPLGLIPLVNDQGVHSFVHTPFSVTCQDGTYQQTGTNLGFPVPIQPTEDPIYDWTLVRGMLRTAPANMNPHRFSAMVLLGSDIVTSNFPPLSSLASCRFNFSALTDASGLPIAPQGVVFTEETESNCDFGELTAKAAAHAQLLPSFPSLLSITRVNAAIYSDTGVAPSLLWARCKRATRSFLLENRYVVNASTTCYSTPGSAEYAADPCCNQDRTWQQCCVPRTVLATATAPNENLLATQCDTPTCSAQVATTYAEVTARQSSAACTAELTANLAGVADIFATPEYSFEQGPCDALFDQRSDDDLIACIVASLDILYVQEFLTLWGITRDELLATPVLIQRSILCYSPHYAIRLTGSQGGFEALVRQRYTLTNGCVQLLGVPSYDVVFKLFLRDTSLDRNSTACVTVPDCNWSGQLSESFCVNSYRGSEMCAACAEGYCRDYTVPQLCYGLNVVSEVYPSVALCVANGGVLDVELKCIYPNRSNSRNNCLPPDICPPSSDTCDPTCHYTAIADRVSCEADTSRLWLPTGACVEYGVLYEDCEAAGGTFFLGATWQEGFLNDRTSCEAIGGYCTLRPGLNQTQCAALAAATTGRCSVYCPGCTPAECEATVGCADGGLFDTTTGGPTCITDFINYGTSVRSCQGYDPVTELGCAFNEDILASSVDLVLSVCNTYAGRLVAAPTPQGRAECESFGRCREANFDPAVTTPKSRDVCTACGGTFLPAFAWTNGTWIPADLPDPIFIPLNWTARTFAPRYFVDTFFDRAKFADDFYTIRVLRSLRIANQNALCRNAQLQDLVSSLACDCLGGNSSACYTTPQFQLLLLQRVCAAATQPFPFTARPDSGSFAVSVTAEFSPACVDVEVSVVPVELFRRANNRVYASVFVQTISGDQYDVIQNSRSIIVGALVGDGVRLTVNGGAIDGAIELCLTRELSAAKRFGVPDFATVNSDLNPESLRALGLSCTTNDTVTCCPVSTSLGQFYFPIQRVDKPQDERLLDTLTSTQRNCFWAAAALYLLLWIVVTYRLVNALLFLILRPGLFPWANLTLLGFVGALLFVATLLRWTYFIVTPLGGLVNASAVGDLIYAELPFYLYLSLFTVFVAWWIEIYHWATSAKKAFLKNARWFLIGANAAMYALFLAVIIAYAAESERTSALRSVCVSPSSGSSNRSARILAKIYKVIVSVIAAVLALGFIVYGSILVRVLTSSSATNVRSVVSFTIVAVTCALGLLVQCGVLLYTTFAPRAGLKTEAALVILIVAEVIPGIALVTVTKQPTTQTGWREYVWCLFRPIESSTTSASNSQYRAASSSGTALSSRASGATSRTTASDTEAGGASSRF